MGFEYKCVGAPERPKRQRGVRGRSDRVALAMQEIIGAEAVDGWEYQRTDLVPVEEKRGIFSRAHEVHRAVLVFRRELEPEPRFVPPGRLRAGGIDTAPQPERPTEHPGDARDAGRAEAPGGRQGGRMTLSADREEPPAPARGGRDEPAAPGRPNRPPSGLG